MTSTPSTPDPVKPLVEATSQAPAQGTSGTSPRKSKRLSSFIWILVMWATLRFLSELDQVSWKRNFLNSVFLLIAYPTIFLCLAIAVRSVKWQRFFRWCAVLILIGTMVEVYTVDNRRSFFYSPMELPVAQAVIFLVVILIARYRGARFGIKNGGSNE